MKKIKVVTIISGIILTIILVLGSSYALFYQEDKLPMKDNYATGILDIELVEEEGYNTVINLNNSLPMSDEDGKKTTPFKLKLKNVGNLSYTFDIKLINTNTENVINSNYLKIMVDDDNPTTLKSGIIKSNITLNPNQEVVVNIRIWLDISTPNSEIGKTFNGKIVAEGIGSKDSSASTQTLEKLHLVANIGEPDFYKTATTGEGIFMAEDDYGISYYFRGAVENNYVKFGEYQSDVYYGYMYEKDTNDTYRFKTYSSLSECQSDSTYNKTCKIGIKKGTPMYWRIIRINGDGSIRMIYDGTQLYENGTETDDRTIGMSPYNEVGTDVNYVGYMYGNAFFPGYTTEDVLDYYSPYENYYPEEVKGSAYENINDSTIKIKLDKFYHDHFLNTIYGNYIADAIYCNNRSGFNDFLGIKYYGGFDYQTIADTLIFKNLKCPHQNDGFTVSDTSKGNGALTYPIGLITGDEAMMAGLRFESVQNGKNYTNYLSGTSTVTMSPNDFFFYLLYESSDEKPIATQISISTYLGATAVTTNLFVRPVISIKGDTNLIGFGTIDNPFRLAS